MNRYFANSILTVLLGAGLVVPARDAAAGRSELATSRPAEACSDPGAVLMEHDISVQATWLIQHARDYGYRDLNELLARDPDLYNRLAVIWRQAHPLPLAA